MKKILIPSGQIERAFSRFLPEKKESSSTVASVPEQETVQPQKRVTARLENTVDGVCPYCKSKMQVSEASGFPVYVCGFDRAVSPIPDGRAVADILVGE